MGSPAERRAGRQARREKLLSMSGAPCGLVNTSPSSPGGVAGGVPGKVRGDHLGDGHSALACVRLRRPEREAAAALLVQLARHPYAAGLDVEIRAPQRGQLAPAQTAENAEQHEGAVPAADRIGPGVDL